MTAKEELIPRDYQIELYEKAVKENVILYLPTGTGKTFIAILLIKHMSADLRKSWDEGKKLNIFIVQTVALIDQQRDCISRLTDLKCSGYSGDVNVDLWTGEKWNNEFRQNQVLVMTPQILLDLLLNSYLELSRINLIVFDECHHGVKNHPMRQIMKIFEAFDKSKHPKILGLSATLINSNINSHQVLQSVKSLEITFNAKVVSVDSVATNNRYKKPHEKIVFYDKSETSVISPELLKKLQLAVQLLSIVDMKKERVNESSPQFQSKPPSMELKNIIDNIEHHFLQLGLYAGNTGVLHFMIQMEKMKHVHHFDFHVIYDYIKTIFIRVQKMAYQQMNESTELENILKYSTDKLLKLLGFLKQRFIEMKLNNQQFCCIIFVKRRTTAKILYHILRRLQALDEDFKLTSEYVIGNNSTSYKNPRESMCLKKWNMEGLLRFRTGESNCLIATQVLDEGVDIPNCSLVINFDLPDDFRSYVQSRGRARDENSLFVIFAENGDENFGRRYNEFQNVEQSLKEHIVKSPDERIKPLPKEINTVLYSWDIEPYVVVDRNGITSQITEISAIITLNNYCMKLGKSKFSDFQPVYKLYKKPSKTSEDLEYYVVTIDLPLLSPLRDTIHGNAMTSIKSAKRSAAMETCKKLHKMGELTDRLIPISINDVSEDIALSLKYWQEESPENERKVGEPRNKRFYDVSYPKVFYNAFPLPNENAYLHVIDAKPTYSAPIDNRDLIIYNLLGSSLSYAILSSKQVPKLPDFAIYVKMGKVNVKFQTNFKCLKLTSEQIQELRYFHWLIFKDILSVIKEFVMFDSHNQENSFLVVPVDKDGEINWSVIRNYKSLKSIYPENIPQNAIKNGIAPVIPRNCSDWELVSPTYRSAMNTYVVTKVCHHLNPTSTFPTEDYVCYAHYFKEKHNINISDLTQPLLEVKAISDKINFIRKRAPESLNKRERDLEEHLIPELCCKINFPAVYYLKARILPSVLHRINQLLIAEELRQQIATEAQLEFMTDAECQGCWEALHFSDDEIDSDEENTSDNIDDIDCDIDMEDILNESDDHDTSKEDIKIESDLNISSLNKNTYPWPKNKEPRDLERSISEITLMEIEYYNNFLNSENSDESFYNSSENLEKFIAPKQISKIPTLNIINKTTEGYPGSAHLLPALVVKIAGDSINLERLETLGDSFLKFFVSLYLFEQYPCQPEGRLTWLKGKIISNRHLFYCGVNKGIPGRLKVENFVPKSNFPVPSYSTPQEIKQIIRSQNIAPSVLYEVTIPPSQQFQGVMSDQIREKFLSKISSWITATNSTGVEQFLNIQNIGDKTIADAVEAVVGVYLEKMSLLGTGKILKWFGIIPDQVNIEKVLFGTPLSAALNRGNVSEHLYSADRIEKTLGYKFKDRTFLLQAFTHGSYFPNRITSSYDRLEFLGDSIIDFLITVYIYETYNNLSPGELTDLRSALVNNITFACLTVKYQLHTALLSYTPLLLSNIERFVEFQQSRDYAVDDDLFWVLLEDNDCDVAEYIDVPKILGDLFESVIGAVFLDSGKDLNKTWSVLYLLMHEEIEKFCKNVPKQAIRVLYETPGAKPKFFKAEVNENTKKILVTVQIEHLGKFKYFQGIGSTKKLAKIGAAKRALKYLQQCNQLKNESL